MVIKDENELENNKVCRKCPLHCAEAIQGTSSEQPAVAEIKPSETGSSQTSIISKELHISFKSGEDIDNPKHDKRNLKNRNVVRINCDCRETWQLNHQRRSIGSGGSGGRRHSHVPIPCCSCIKESRTSTSSSRKEFDIKQHGWREWEKPAEEDAKRESEESKKSIIDSIVKTFEDDKNKPMLERISQKKIDEMQKERKPASKRYGVNAIRLSHVDPDGRSSTNN